MPDPYLRPAAPEGEPPAPCPPGHIASPAGVWNGRNCEVVYDPDRHDVAMVRGCLDGRLTGGLAATGFVLAQGDGESSLWVRDRMAALRHRLDRLERPACTRPRRPRIA